MWPEVGLAGPGVLVLGTPPSDAHNGATRPRQHRRHLCRLIHSLRLPDKQRHRRGTTLTIGELKSSKIVG